MLCPRRPFVFETLADAFSLLTVGPIRKCTTCLEPATKLEAGMPLCLKCRRIKLGLVSSCDICSVPIRPSMDRSCSNLCERCNFACFRCGRPTLVARNASYITCDSCGLAWKAGVLGYELVEQALQGTKIAQARATKFEKEGPMYQEHLGESEIQYYASRWQSIQ